MMEQCNKSVWVRKIMEERKEKDRLAKSQRVVGTQYNIQNAHSILEDYYKELESKNVSIGKTMICTTNCTLTTARIDAKSKFNTIFFKKLY